MTSAYRLLLFAALMVPCTTRAETYAQKLGWKADDVVLILHIDDAGMSHASNLGVMQSTEQGAATSFSIMMPCPWVPELVNWIKKNPTVDSGLHLTMTAEWKLYRWGPLAGKSVVPGLVDEQGCLWHSVEQVCAHATPDEIETEIRAQILRAEKLGIEITHLDSHMGTLFARADYFERFLKVGIERKIPILAVGGHMTHAMVENGDAAKALKPLASKIWDAGLPVIDDLHTSVTSWKPPEKKERVLQLIRELKPGITEILFHASVMTEEFPLITGSAASRHADTEFLKSPELKALIKERNIHLTTWRELKKRRDQVGK
ncbi:MAG TPA: polysaccharide deacetylase family protein [Verrucomicrobiae bacterium]